jgi:hypothetical protein
MVVAGAELEETSEQLVPVLFKVCRLNQSYGYFRIPDYLFYHYEG